MVYRINIITHIVNVNFRMMTVNATAGFSVVSELQYMRRCELIDVVNVHDKENRTNDSALRDTTNDGCRFGTDTIHADNL